MDHELVAAFHTCRETRHLALAHANLSEEAGKLTQYVKHSQIAG